MFLPFYHTSDKMFSGGHGRLAHRCDQQQGDDAIEAVELNWRGLDVRQNDSGILPPVITAHFTRASSLLGFTVTFPYCFTREHCNYV